MLLLLELGLGRSADLDDGNAAAQLREPLLKLFAIVVAVGLLDLSLDLGEAAHHVGLAARALDDRRVFLRDDDLLSRAEHVDRHVLKLRAEVLRNKLALREDSDVLQHGLAAIAEARRLHRAHLQHAANLVEHHGGQSVAFDILGNDQNRLAGGRHALEEREQVLCHADLLLVDQDQRILEHRFHPLGVGDEVRADVAAVELHALDDFERRLAALALFDRDDAVLADLVHRLGNLLADLGVVARNVRDEGDLVLALDRLGGLLNLGNHDLDGLVDAALYGDRVAARGHVAQALVDNALGEHRGRGGAVAGDVVGLAGDFLAKLGAHVLVGVFEFDFFGDRHAVLGDRGAAPLLVEDHVAALGAEGHLDRVGDLVDASLQRTPRILIVE